MRVEKGKGVGMGLDRVVGAGNGAGWGVGVGKGLSGVRVLGMRLRWGLKFVKLFPIDSKIKVISSSMASKKQKKNEDKYSLSDLKTLGHQLLSSRAHINNLPLLLSFITPSTRPKYALESLLSLQSFFLPLLPQLPSSTHSVSQNDPEFIYRTWVRSKFDDFVQYLLDIAICSESNEALREVVLDTLMEFVKVGNGGKFHSAIYHRLLDRVVHSSLDVHDVLLDLLSSKYFKYIDIRYFTYISFKKLSQRIGAKDISDDRREGLDTSGVNQPESSLDLSVLKLYHLLSHIPPLEGSDVKSNYDMWNAADLLASSMELSLDPLDLPENFSRLQTSKTEASALPAAMRTDRSSLSRRVEKQEIDPCQLFWLRCSSMVVRREDHEDTTAVIVAGKGLAVATLGRSFGLMTCLINCIDFLFLLVLHHQQSLLSYNPSFSDAVPPPKHTLIRLRRATLFSYWENPKLSLLDSGSNSQSFKKLIITIFQTSVKPAL
ncbi:Nucleolar complex protein 4, putative isoform 2 [Capsicum annuum]|nr:Nucleolar complex protein 4, putative isoform 2 [Capsicum annuum]